MKRHYPEDIREVDHSVIVKVVFFCTATYRPNMKGAESELSYVQRGERALTLLDGPIVWRFVEAVKPP